MKCGFFRLKKFIDQKLFGVRMMTQLSGDAEDPEGPTSTLFQPPSLSLRSPFLPIIEQFNRNFEIYDS
jgi:hypothetical protein